MLKIIRVVYNVDTDNGSTVDSIGIIVKDNDFHKNELHAKGHARYTAFLHSNGNGSPVREAIEVYGSAPASVRQKVFERAPNMLALCKRAWQVRHMYDKPSDIIPAINVLLLDMPV